MTDRCVIYSTGMTGLEVGALLARRGTHVVYLQGAREGARDAIETRDGFILDGGIHMAASGQSSALSRIARKLGFSIDWVQPGLSHVEDSYGHKRIFPTSRPGLIHTRFFNMADRLQASGKAWWLWRHEDLSGLMRTSLEAWMREEGIGGGVRQFLEVAASALTVCPYPQRASAGQLLTELRAIMRGESAPAYPKGGWAPIQETLRQAITQSGEIHAAEGTPKVRFEGTRATGIEVGGTLYEGTQIVLDHPLVALPELLKESALPKTWLDACATLEPTAGIAIDYALGAQSFSDKGWRYFYEQKAYGLFVGTLEPAVVPEGHDRFTVFRPSERSDLANPSRRAWLINDLDNAVRNAFPELPDAVLWQRTRDLSCVDGVEVNCRQSVADRMGCVVPEVERLYVCGGGVKAPGCGGNLIHNAAVACYEALASETL